MSARSRARPWFNDVRWRDTRADLVHQPPVPGVRGLLLSWMTPDELAELAALERIYISPSLSRAGFDDLQEARNENGRPPRG